MGVQHTVFRALLLAVGASHLVEAQVPQAWEDLDPSYDINSYPNNSLYLRWRPTYHVLAANGHMNDPCGLMYDPATQLYHLFYQAFPQHVNFGNTSWAHATSTDLVSWTDVRGWENRSMVAIEPGPFGTYDWVGTFSGGAQAVNLHGEVDGNLTLMYTGASKFPDNWQLPYAEMTEQQVIATSSDGGQTWQKYDGNPVIDGAPGGWNVTGLRDPIFQQLPELDEILGHARGSHWYMVLGSGIRYLGPRIPLYQAPADDLTNWTFLGGLFEVGANASWSGDQTTTGNFGYNFELVGLFPLLEREENGGDGETVAWVVTMGAEGLPADFHPVDHWSLFSIGTMTRRVNGSAEFTITASGVLDWAGSYAFNQFYDPIHDRRLIWGWTDEDFNDNGSKPQGFQGSLGLPRELYMKVIHHVLPPAGGIGKSAETWTANRDGSYTVRTLGQRPADDVVAGIQGDRRGTSLGSRNVSDAAFLDGLNSSTFHLRFTVPPVPEDGRISILLRASPDYAEYTNVTYRPSNASVIVDRSMSTLYPNLTKDTYVGHIEPFVIYHPETGTNATEPLRWDIYVDGSLLEIFINDRFSLNTRVYPTRANATLVAMEGSDGAEGPVTVEQVTYWTEMLNVWPNRPLNASSPLVFDQYYQTHVTFPNPYVAVNETMYDGYRRWLHPVTEETRASGEGGN